MVTPTLILISTKTSIPPTSIPTPILPATLTPPPTLAPEQAKETLSNLLQNGGVDCSSPCVLGIIPGQSSFEEVRNSFIDSGFPVEQQCVSNESCSVSYKFDSGLSVRVPIVFKNDVVESFRIIITPEKKISGKLREWLAYSPEMLIRRYGTPSKVEFFVGELPSPLQAHMMTLYFESIDLIVNYYSYDDEDDTGVFRICPLLNQQDVVSIWFGKNPIYPPLPAVPLEEATSMTLEEFSKLMTGEREDACIDLK